MAQTDYTEHSSSPSPTVAFKKVVPFPSLSEPVAKTYPLISSSSSYKTKKPIIPTNFSVSCSLSMDTLSASVSTLKVPTLPSTSSNRELLFYHFKRTPYATTPPYVFSTSTPNLVSKTKSFSQKSSSSLPLSSPLKPKPSSPTFHRNPATGYAAAIIDVAQNSNSLHLVQKDVQRLLKLLQSTLVDPSVVVERGNFHRHVAALLKMLVKKNKLGIVKEVLEEFEKIYDELCGTQVVLVSSMTKMGKDELFGIAKRVHQLSGAGRVKVRNLIQQSSPSFAV